MIRRPRLLDLQRRVSAFTTHHTGSGVSMPESTDRLGPVGRDPGVWHSVVVERSGEIDSTTDADVTGVRRGRTFVALAAAVVVVVLVASVTVVLTRRGGSGSNVGGLTIDALAATTQKQSARMIATVNLPPIGGEGSPASNNCLVAVGEPCSSSRQPATASVLVLTGLIDFRSGNGRVDFATRTGSHGSLKRFATDLLVDGHEYGSINASTVDIPAEIRHTKRWIESKIATLRAGLNPFDPLAVFKDHHVKLDDRGVTRLGDQSVRHYQGVMHILYTPPSTNGPTVTVTSTIDIYVDTHNRLVRLHAIEQSPSVGTSTAQIDFSDYGVHVNITAPPASQVVRDSDLPPHS
jgi:hypothetical protein